MLPSDVVPLSLRANVHDVGLMRVGGDSRAFLHRTLIPDGTLRLH